MPRSGHEGLAEPFVEAASDSDKGQETSSASRCSASPRNLLVAGAALAATVVVMIVVAVAWGGRSDGSLPITSRCSTLCPGCSTLPCDCPADACWPGGGVDSTPDPTCDCFAKLTFCAPGTQPVYTHGKKCPSCWPAENHACDCFATLGFCDVADPWPMFMRTPSHDASASPDTAREGAKLSAELSAAWVHNMSHVVSSSPTLIGDVVLAASGCGPDPCEGGAIAAIYRTSGDVKWLTPLGSGVAYSSPMPSTDRSLVYIGTDEGKVVAINVETGTVTHAYQTDDTVTSTPCVAPDGSVYVGSHDNNLYKLDAQLNLVWAFATGGQVWSSPTINDDGTIVYVGSVDKRIYAVDANSGELAWQYNTTGRIKGSPVFNTHQVLVGSFEDKCVYALDAADGHEVWRFVSQDFIFSSPAVVVAEDGTETVIVTSTDSFVYGVNRLSGQMLWKVKTGSYIDASPAIDGARAIVAADDGVLYVIDVASGTIASHFSDGMAGSESSAAVGHDGIYVGSSDGCVRKIV